MSKQNVIASYLAATHEVDKMKHQTRFAKDSVSTPRREATSAKSPCGRQAHFMSGMLAQGQQPVDGKNSWQSRKHKC